LRSISGIDALLRFAREPDAQRDLPVPDPSVVVCRFDLTMAYACEALIALEYMGAGPPVEGRF
jgi:hypothetical protein